MGACESEGMEAGEDFVSFVSYTRFIFLLLPAEANPIMTVFTSCRIFPNAARVLTGVWTMGKPTYTFSRKVCCKAHPLRLFP